MRPRAVASPRVGRVVLRGQLVTDSEVAAAVVRVLKGFEFPVTAVVPQLGRPLLRPNAGQPVAPPRLRRHCHTVAGQRPDAAVKWQTPPRFVIPGNDLVTMGLAALS